MHYYKYHGLGNDYIVIDPVKTDISLTAGAIRMICSRNYGIGSDGILYGPLYDDDRIRLRIFNPDGSEAEKSGNGVRIFGRYLYESGHVRNRSFSFVTAGGPIKVDILENDASLIQADMGTFTFDSRKIPVTGPRREIIDDPIEIRGLTYRMTCVSVGNPHCVIPLETISKELACSIGPEVENHPQFPKRINMQLMSVLDRNTIRIEIWERGAGYTLASGTSSCAAACAARKLGLTDDQVAVLMPGGELAVDINENRIRLTGPVSSVSEGNFTDEFMGKITDIRETVFTEQVVG